MISSRGAWRLSPLLLLLLVFSLPRPSAAQADQQPYSVNVFNGKALLAYGDHLGTYRGGTILKRFSQFGWLGVTTGIVSSSDLGYEPGEDLDWRHRQLYLMEGIGHFDVVQFRLSRAILNRLSFKMGLSYQYSREETPVQVTGPDIEPLNSNPAVMDFALRSGKAYAYNVDGQIYNVHALERSAGSIGTVLSLEYAVKAGPAVVAAEGAFRHYRTGTPFLSYGISLGLQY